MTTITRRVKLNWKQKILRDLERVEKLQPELTCIVDDWPEWARQMAVEFCKTAIPRVNFGKWDDLTANEVGRCVGVKQAAIAQSEHIEMTAKQEEAVERLLISVWGEKTEEKMMEQIKFYEEKFFPAYERAVRRALAAASRQTPREQADFFKGFSQMVGENPDARANSSTRIYFFMILFWRQIEAAANSGRFSVSQLHTVLCQVFGSHIVGDKKRIEKMCERKGLHFRKRGRPVVPDKSDTKAA
jgi:hypothetical protein